VLASGLLAIPTAYSSGLDVLPLPKELVFRGEAVLWLDGELRAGAAGAGLH
jgi:hypothetical protein